MKFIIKLKNIFIKIFNKEKYVSNKQSLTINADKEIFERKFENYINKVQETLKKKKQISFLHSGHIGDIINILPVIKELSKNHICKLFIQLDLPIPVYYNKHPAGQFYLNKKIYNMLYPLLKEQTYIKEINIFKNQEIDINFDIIRKLPLNLLFDNARYGFHIAGIQYNLNNKFIDVEEHSKIKNKIVILRSLRYQNHFINYNFLENFENAYYIGTQAEYVALKKDLKNLEFYECKDFLDMAKIIKSSRVLIGNSSLGIDIAEGLKTPRLLEASPYFPARQIHGENGFDFYFQSHFEKYFNILYNKKY
tara:strand:- start:5344 stop:6267 length:924 start_codon:yes stop_codon:yes gene_type:complete